MKYFAVVLLLATVVCADEWTPKGYSDLIAARGVCATKHNINEDTLAKYKKWEFADDDLTKTYVTCIFKEFGLFCDHEGFHIDRLVLQFRTAHGVDIQPTVENCAAKRDTDTTNEVRVFRAFRCFTAEHLNLVKAKLSNTN